MNSLSMQFPKIESSFSRGLSPRHACRLLATGLVVAIVAACSGGADGAVGPASTGVADQPGTPPASSPGTTSGYSNPLAGTGFYINPNSPARRQVESWMGTRPDDAKQIEKIAARPMATWLAEWAGDIYSAVTGTVKAAEAQSAMPIFVAYAIPNRDCGSFSAGGLTPAAYRTWIASFANALSGKKAAVILEPDAISNMDCLPASGQQERLDLIKYAIQALKAQSGVAVYIDAGHAAWHSPEEAARRLRLAGVDRADGFALNVSNFIATATSTAYGQAISSLIGGKHFVIDTSRNGLGPTADLRWCNPPGRALGASPTAMTSHPLVDAYIWVKIPGESDGACDGAPKAGVWWPDYALGLAQRAD